MSDRQCKYCEDQGCGACSEWCEVCRRWIFMGLSNPGHRDCAGSNANEEKTDA